MGCERAGEYFSALRIPNCTRIEFGEQGFGGHEPIGIFDQLGDFTLIETTV